MDKLNNELCGAVLLCVREQWLMTAQNYVRPQSNSSRVLWVQTHSKYITFLKANRLDTLHMYDEQIHAQQSLKQRYFKIYSNRTKRFQNQIKVQRKCKDVKSKVLETLLLNDDPFGQIQNMGVWIKTLLQYVKQIEIYTDVDMKEMESNPSRTVIGLLMWMKRECREIFTAVIKGVFAELEREACLGKDIKVTHVSICNGMMNQNYLNQCFKLRSLDFQSFINEFRQHKVIVAPYTVFVRKITTSEHEHNIYHTVLCYLHKKTVVAYENANKQRSWLWGKDAVVMATGDYNLVQSWPKKCMNVAGYDDKNDANCEELTYFGLLLLRYLQAKHSSLCGVLLDKLCNDPRQIYSTVYSGASFLYEYAKKDLPYTEWKKIGNDPQMKAKNVRNIVSFVLHKMSNISTHNWV